MANLEASIERKRVTFQDAILRWADSNTRHYAWRDKRRSPYEILIAELLLKRTTAAAASSVYEEFLKKYPSIDALAEAKEEELADNFKSVGLYRQRAKAALKLSEHLIKYEAGTTPNSMNRLSKVPGLGSYSARAVLSFGHDKPEAVVDSNVTRILRRVFEHDLPDRPTARFFSRISRCIAPGRNPQRVQLCTARPRSSGLPLFQPTVCCMSTSENL